MNNNMENNGNSNLFINPNGVPGSVPPVQPVQQDTMSSMSVQSQVVQQPMMQSQMTQQPMMNQPTMNQPMPQVMTQQPVAQQPVSVAQPIVQQPVMSQQVQQVPQALVSPVVSQQQSVVQPQAVQPQMMGQPMMNQQVQQPMMQPQMAQQQMIQQQMVQQPMMNQQYVQTTWTPIQNDVNPSNSNKTNKNVLIIGGVIIAFIVLALSVIFVPKILGTGDNIQSKYSDRFIMALDMDEKVLYLAEKKGNYYKAIMEASEINLFFGYFDNKLVIGEGSEIKYADMKAENKEFKTLLTMPKYCNSTNTTCVSQTILHVFGYKKRFYFQSVREDPKDEENILCDLSYIKEGQDYDDRQVVLSGINCLAVINYDEKRNVVYYLTDDETPVLKSFNLKNNKEKELAQSVKAFDFNGKDELIYYQANTFKLYNLKNNMITTLFNDEYATVNNIFSLSFLDDYLYYSTYDIENANDLLKTYNLETKEDKVIDDDILSLGTALRSLYGKKVNVSFGYSLSYAIDGELIRNKDGLEKLEITLEKPNGEKITAYMA